ncbi:monovalent cation/H+ antiporter complex subunit F [Deinococcus peraridilitoris]|uniref:Multisubunit Na+/H+ antiporter, MnhF subunit n=1 Tax=Deinococcus peraridilitoris (strain DSM 19664 / LMG 22246 / CIP 109416 / KR-200) TaxID=937777 RepID=K9ZYJ8_DEIPD|nr:monovalent cation/H+ antiporter complex subunit F [Deinococcus peraridilitoris]AFZ66646.1 multisubunit Na+/H+ antiporter, MnhF subunit [Deinococcus peraridilitoris DSM 19664]
MLAVNIALVVVALSTVLVTYRVLRGPSWGDRIMAFDFLSVNLVVLFVLLAIRERFASFLDAALVLSLLGFLGTVALARFLLLGRVMK